MDERHLEVLQGDTLAIEIEYQNDDGTPVDLDGYSAHMQLRTVPNSSTVVLDLSTTNGRITIAEGGVLMLAVDAETMAAVAPGEGRYDLEVTSETGVVTKIMRGPYTILPEVTR